MHFNELVFCLKIISPFTNVTKEEETTTLLESWSNIFDWKKLIKYFWLKKAEIIFDWKKLKFLPR